MATAPGPGGDALPARAGLVRRALARAIDLVPFVACAWTGNPFVFVLGIVWILVADGVVPGGRSPGKRLLGLRVAFIEPEAVPRKPDVRESALRNLPIAVVALLGIHPIGWVLFPFVGLAVVVAELWLSVRDPQGRRFGDRFAGTMVASATPGEEGLDGWARARGAPRSG